MREATQCLSTKVQETKVGVNSDLKRNSKSINFQMKGVAILVKLSKAQKRGALDDLTIKFEQTSPQ